MTTLAIAIGVGVPMALIWYLVKAVLARASRQAVDEDWSQDAERSNWPSHTDKA